METDLESASTSSIDAGEAFVRAAAFDCARFTPFEASSKLELDQVSNKNNSQDSGVKVKLAMTTQPAITNGSTNSFVEKESLSDINGCSDTKRMVRSVNPCKPLLYSTNPFTYSKYEKLKREWRQNVYLSRSNIQGRGLFAARDIEKHTMIIEYIGEVIRTVVSEMRKNRYESEARGMYMFRMDKDLVVDATLSGGLARFINHSCNPNCRTRIFKHFSDKHIIIFAKRKIYRNEELSYDYMLDFEDKDHKIPCTCGAPKCRKWMN